MICRLHKKIPDFLLDLPLPIPPLPTLVFGIQTCMHWLLAKYKLRSSPSLPFGRNANFKVCLVSSFPLFKDVWAPSLPPLFSPKLAVMCRLLH